MDSLWDVTQADLGAYFVVIKEMSDVADAMSFFDGTAASVPAIDGYYAEVLDADTGDFLMQLVGVIDDPFAMM